MSVSCRLASFTLFINSFLGIKPFGSSLSYTYNTGFLFLYCFPAHPFCFKLFQVQTKGQETSILKTMDSNKSHLLIIDDDPGIRDLLSRYLSEQGYQVSAVGDAQEMDSFLSTGDNIDLVILDLMLPGEDGLSIAKRLRTSHNLPIIMLSARGEDIDRIVGLEVGADDYLPKPFNPRELLARIRAVLRRQQGDPQAQSADKQVEQGVVHFGVFSLNLVRRTLHKGEQDIPLTSGEFNLLQIFTEHPNRALSRDQIVDFIKGYDRSPFDRSIDVRVTRLRQKIESDPKQPDFVRTIWGVGYMFTPDGQE